MNEKKELFKNTIIILLGKTCNQLLSFLLLPLYTSYLVTSDFGLVDLIITYISLLVPILSFQLDMSTFRFLIDCRENETKQDKIISTNLFTLLFISLFIILFSFLIFKFVNIKYIFIIIPIIIATIFSNNLMQISRGLGDNLSFSITSVIIGSSTIILNVLLIVFLKFGAKGMLLSMLFANILGVIYLSYKLRIFKKVKKKNFEYKLFKEMMKYSVPLIPNGITWWIMSASDRTFISIFLNIGANGIYAISNKFPSLLTSFFGIFNLAWSESAALNINKKEKDIFFSSVCNDIVNVFGMLGIIIIVLMPFLFPLLINKQYSDAYIYIPILLVSCIFSLMASQYGSIYIAVKNTKKLAITTYISALINILVDLILIKKIGLYAAAISTVISYFVIMIYRHYDTKKYIQINYNFKRITLLIFAYIITIVSYYINNTLINAMMILLVFFFFLFYEKIYFKRIIFFFKRKIFKK